MKRRALLTALAGSPLLAAGCSSNQSCESVSITEASVAVDYGCDAGELRTGSIEGRAEGCSMELTLEMLDDGESVEEVSFEPTDQEWSVGFGEGVGWIQTIPSQGDKRVAVRGPDDEVLAEAQLSVSHYLDEPALDVWRPQFEPETVSVGEPVTVTFSIATFGAGASFSAALLIDGEPVATRDGTVEAGIDCQRASGPAYEFTHTFDEPGTYELGGRITVDDASQGGDVRSIGTVTVTE